MEAQLIRAALVGTQSAPEFVDAKMSPLVVPVPAKSRTPSAEDAVRL